MVFNVKTRQAQALWAELLEQPEGRRRGFTGFWVASLDRVREQGIVRIADLETGRFLFEADIDPDETHMMTMSRFDEYRRHEELKSVDAAYAASLGPRDEAIRNSIAHGRIVVWFRNARAISGPMNHNGSNPVWYTDD